MSATDPTRTKTRRKQFRQALNSRFRDVRGELRSYVQGLRVDGTDARTIRRFRSKLRTELQSKLVEPADDRTVQRGTHWTATYVRHAYDRGLRDAKADLRETGTDERAIQQATRSGASEHDSVRTRAYLTTFYDLEDAADRLHTHGWRSIAESLRNDDGSTQLVDDVTETLRSKGNTSLTALANTTIIRTYNEALLTSYELADVEEVGLIPEGETQGNGSPRQNAAGELVFETAGDRRVCPTCMGIAGSTMSVSEIQQNPALRPPIHPNCRCRWAPTAMMLKKEDTVIPP